MRKIEQAMVNAIKAGKSASIGNTAVTVNAMNKVVTLHGNTIAVIHNDGMRLTLAGWPTPTTRSRLNALIRTFAPGEGGFYQRHGFQHVTGRGEVSSTEWIDFPTA